MPSLNRIKNVTRENCGTQTTKPSLARHEKICCAGKLCCTHCPNFSTKSQIDLNYHFAEKHRALKPDLTFTCKLCYREFAGFYSFRQDKSTQHDFPIKTAMVEPENILYEVDDANLIEELRPFPPFLVDSELERARLKVFNYAVENINETVVDEKLDHF